MAKAKAPALEPVPDELVEAAYLLVTNEIGEQGPAEMYALYQDRFEVAGTAARNVTLLDAARQFGIPLERQAFPVDAFTREWAARESAKRVAQVSEATRRGIAQVIAQGIWEQRGVAGTGRAIRPLLQGLGADMIRNSGLTAQDVGRVRTFSLDLVAGGYSPKQVESMTTAYSRRLLRRRGETIARTEMRDAVTAGGLVQDERYGANEKAWATVGDDRVSNICNTNQAQGWIPIDRAFVSGHQGPTSHPRCRCHLNTRGMTDAQFIETLRSEGVLGPG